MPTVRKLSALGSSLTALLACGGLALAACATDPDAPPAPAGLEADLLGLWETMPSQSGWFSRYDFRGGGKMHLSSYFSEILENGGTYRVLDSMLIITLMAGDTPIDEDCFRIFEVGDSAFLGSGLLMEAGEGGRSGLVGNWHSVSTLPDDAGIPRITGFRFHADGTLIVTAPTAIDTARYVVDGGTLRVTEFTAHRPAIDYGFALRGNRLSLWETGSVLKLFRIE